VLQPQVAVALHDASPGPTPVETAGVLIVEAVGVEAERLVRWAREQVADVPLRLREIPLGHRPQAVDPPRLGYLGRRGA